MIYSGFWKRFVASMIDMFILILPSFLLSRFTFGVGGVLIGLLYKPVFEASSLSATPGKAIMGMVVLTSEGERLNFKQSYIRYFASILSGILLGFGYIMAIFTEKKQTLHDLIAGTIVISRDAPDVNYFHLWLKEVEILFKRLSSSLSASEDSSNFRTAPTREIEDLYKLYQSGALTEEEYRAQKAKLLK